MVAAGGAGRRADALDALDAAEVLDAAREEAGRRRAEGGERGEVNGDRHGDRHDGTTRRQLRRLKAEERAPLVLPHEERVTVTCELVGKGEFRVIVVPTWAPLGAERFLQLVEIGFFEDAAMFRPVKDFLVQFGIPARHDLKNEWRDRRMEDDPKRGIRIGEGTLAFAGSGPNSRTTQMFIALSDRHWPHLGKEPWETPFGYVEPSDYQRVITRLNTEYGDMAPFNKEGVDVGRLWSQGNDYLEQNFPRLDYLRSCRITSRAKGEEAAFGSNNAWSEFLPLSGQGTELFLLTGLAFMVIFLACLRLAFGRSSLKSA